MRIALSCDHASFRYKEEIKRYLAGRGHQVRDFGTHSEESVDYPRFIRPAAESVARGECDRAVVLSGSGNGKAIAANRVHGVRCILAWNEESARLSRAHNDANALSLGQRLLPLATALELVRIWLDTPFEGSRHERRLRQLDKV